MSDQLVQLLKEHGYHGAISVDDVVNRYANDAMPVFGATTDPNAGVPWYSTLIADPKIIQTLVTPCRAAEIYGERQYGGFETTSLQMTRIEFGGVTASYGDYSNDGSAEFNTNIIYRDFYNFQTWKSWGYQESLRNAKLLIDTQNQKNIAANLLLRKAENYICIFGMEGMQTYGALNSPSLPSMISPTPKTDEKGNIVGQSWTSTNDPVQIYQDILYAYSQLMKQLGGNLEVGTRIKLVLPLERFALLKSTNKFNVVLQEVLDRNFNIVFECLAEAGDIVDDYEGKKPVVMQLFAEMVMGQDVSSTLFNVKMIGFNIEKYSSYSKQKLGSGSAGTVWYLPVACVTMVGI